MSGRDLGYGDLPIIVMSKDPITQLLSWFRFTRNDSIFRPAKYLGPFVNGPFEIRQDFTRPKMEYRFRTPADYWNQFYFAMDALRAAGLAPPRITVATASSNLRGEMLATGRYLTMVPRYWVLLPRRHPSLRVLPVDFPNTRLKVAIITLKNRSLSQATQLFIDSVRAITKPLAREK